MKFNRILPALSLTIAALFAAVPAVAEIVPAAASGNVNAYHPNLTSTQSWLTINWLDRSPNAGLVYFDLSAYAGAQVSQAGVRLHHNANYAPGAVFGLFRLTSAWDPQTVTWNSAPSFDPTPVGGLVLGDEWEGWYTVDVTSTVNGWLSGAYANYGFGFARLDQDHPYAYFDGANSGYAPLLVGIPVPEPETYALMAIGLLGVAAARRRKSAR